MLAIDNHDKGIKKINKRLITDSLSIASWSFPFTYHKTEITEQQD